MTPQDDPEARIRDLERPFADTATELGVGGPPPTQPWSYDSFPPPPNPGRSGLKVFGIVAAVLTAGIAAGAVVYVLSSGAAENTTSGRPTFSGGGGGFPSPTARRPTVPPVPTGAPDAPVVVETLPPGGVVTVAGVDGHKTLACNDNTVSVSGVNNTVTITGHCAALTVSGVENVIVVDSVDRIGVSGLKNRITFRSGAPEIEQSGFDNVVGQG
ncbi:DUF3060 domain-containing protein [Mycobacterium sp. ACS4331]|uniref:DUF3060 domain-containing protein n=1 Tax=Mycobacterium sp. ACS4331 TaxID=1834121 RepID=UPI0009EDAD10|nr:DUF3060 domain-containing protein [Mycobacterium sp. ACS4331]